MKKLIVLLLVLTMAVALLLGLFHGFLVAILRIQPFVVTFATQTAINGVTIAITNAQFITPGYDGLFYKISNGTLFGIPMAIVWFLVFVAVPAFVFGKTPYGRRCYFKDPFHLP